MRWRFAGCFGRTRSGAEGTGEGGAPRGGCRSGRQRRLRGPVVEDVRCGKLHVRALRGVAAAADGAVEAKISGGLLRLTPAAPQGATNPGKRGPTGAGKFHPDRCLRLRRPHPPPLQDRAGGRPQWFHTPPPVRSPEESDGPPKTSVGRRGAIKVTLRTVDPGRACRAPRP